MANPAGDVFKNLPSKPGGLDGNGCVAWLSKGSQLDIEFCDYPAGNTSIAT